MNIDEIKQQYMSNQLQYKFFCEETVKQLQVLLDRDNIKLAVPIDFRVKEWDSIYSKIERKYKEISDINEIKDVCGIRIVLLFKKDIDTVQEIIKDNFSVIGEDDTSTRLSDNQFGYGSIHYEIKLKDSWIEVPTFRSMGEFIAEIQVRTAAQHIWAATSHVLQYKKEEHVPLELRRSISRAAALLEVVDLEFERVLMERRNIIQETKPDSPINTDTLRELLDRMLPEINKTQDENYGEMVDDLIKLSFDTIGLVEAIIKKHIEKVLEDDRIYAKRRNELTFFSHAGLLRRILRKEFGDEEIDKIIDSRRKEVSAIKK